MKFPIKNLDRMVVISAVQEGSFIIHDNIENKEFNSKKDDVTIFCSSRQDFILELKKIKKNRYFHSFYCRLLFKKILKFKSS